MLADEPAHLLLQPLPLKALVPQAARLWLKQISEARQVVPTSAFCQQLIPCLTGNLNLAGI